MVKCFWKNGPFCCFSFFSRCKMEKGGFSGIQTPIVREEGEQYDHLNTTTAQAANVYFLNHPLTTDNLSKPGFDSNLFFQKWSCEWYFYDKLEAISANLIPQKSENVAVINHSFRMNLAACILRPKMIAQNSFLENVLRCEKCIHQKYFRSSCLSFVVVDIII